MRDLEKSPPQEEEVGSLLTIPMSPTRRNKSQKCVVLCILLAIVALVTVLVPVSQGRLSTMVDSAYEFKKAFKTAQQSTVSTEEALDMESSEIVAKEASAKKAAAADDTTRMHVDYHTNRFDYTSSWCPLANCTGTPICYPCQRRWLLIITTGRSASTTLTEMLQRLPGVRMTGENNNMIGKFENWLKDAPRDMIVGEAPAWFHNPIPDESWSCASQTLFTTVNPPKLVLVNDTNGDGDGRGGEMVLLEESDEKTILGFKTIRLFDETIKKNSYKLTQMQIQELAQAKIETLNHLFPCARFVLNFRSDINGQLASWKAQFGATNPESATKLIQLDNDLLHSFHKTVGPERSFLLDSTEWTQNISSFNEMVDWLGFSGCNFPAALEYNTKDGYFATKTEADLSPDCKYLYY